MYVADADGEQVDASRADEVPRAVRVGLCALAVREAWNARRKFAELGFDRDVARVGVVDQVAHPSRVVVRRRGRVRRHDEIEAGGHCGSGPVVLARIR